MRGPSLSCSWRPTNCKCGISTPAPKIKNEEKKKKKADSFRYHSAWIPNTELTPLTPEMCKEAIEKGKPKALLAAYKVALEQHDLQYFKDLLADHQRALQQEAEAREAKAAAKADREEKKKKRKSMEVVEDQEDVDMAEVEEEEGKKPKATKKRKKDVDSEGEAEKVSASCRHHDPCVTVSMDQRGGIANTSSPLRLPRPPPNLS